MLHFTLGASLIFLFHLIIVVVIGLRIISQKPQSSVALAWLLLVIAAPVLGGLLYLLIGERRISASRAHRFKYQRGERTKIWKQAVAEHSPDILVKGHDATMQELMLLGGNSASSPTVKGNAYQLFSHYNEIIAQLVKDIDTAHKTLLMEFYIWQDAGSVADVIAAMQRAAARGVQVRLLVDAMGSSAWIKGGGPEKFRAQGILVEIALPVGLLHSFVGRADLRLHRKVITIDDRLAWTGSMNMVDPAFFKQNSGVGEWVDAMVRLEGPVIMPLMATVVSDWSQDETRAGQDPLQLFEGLKPETQGEVDIQVYPSGPGESNDGLQLMLATLIAGAKDSLIITTPYFVPDDVILKAIRAAAFRGVKVSLIMPERIDSVMTRYASRSYFDDLCSAGVHIYLFKNGLLHTKSISVDGKLAMFGSVNIDYRSLWLNYEVALFIYHAGFTQTLIALQQSYMSQSDLLDVQTWKGRSQKEQFLENSFRLLAPLL